MQMPFTHARLAPPPADRAIWGILGANVLTLSLTLWNDGGLLALLWPYWVQSVVIGVFAARRILALREFTSEGFEINDQPVDPTAETRDRTAGFFALHYGLFHLVYLIFLLGFTGDAVDDGLVQVTDENTGVVRNFQLGSMGTFDWISAGIVAVSFWLAHAASHREHVAADLRSRPNIGTLMSMPYLRIIPMHLTIIFGAFLGGGGTLLFGALKTIADLAMHRIEHRLLQGRMPQGSS